MRALELVTATPGGLSVQEVADRLGVHRTIAHRLLATLAEHHLIARGPDNRFRAGGGLIALAGGLPSTLRDTAMPIMRELADELESTVVLLVREGEEVVGIAVAAPANSTYHLAFRTGSRHPLGRGSAGICLLSALPARPDERPEVTRARTQGFAVSKGEVEPGAHGLAAPSHQAGEHPQRLPEPDHLPGRHHGRRRPGDARRRRPGQRAAQLTSGPRIRPVSPRRRRRLPGCRVGDPAPFAGPDSGPSGSES